MKSERILMLLRSIVRWIVPRPLRIELLRLKRLPAWLLETRSIGRIHLPEAEQVSFEFVLASHSSPLARALGEVPPALQAGKERNVAIAAHCIDGLLLLPNEIFSYHRTVGRPSRLRGFRPGMELHDGKPSQGVGGGCCQVSNMLYLLALRGGMKVTERHRHGVDLYPDHGRTIPFGCGATVFYNYADLRFENPLPQPVLLRFRVQDGSLLGEIRTLAHPGWTAEIYEVDHRRYREGELWVRENRIRRRFLRVDGSVILDQEVAHNRGRILYTMPEDTEEAEADTEAPAIGKEEKAICCEPH
jgi:vancomycin resistance protein VanW